MDNNEFDENNQIIDYIPRLDENLEHLLDEHKLTHIKKSLLLHGFKSIADVLLLHDDQDIELIVPVFLDKMKMKGLIRKYRGREEMITGIEDINVSIDPLQQEDELAAVDPNEILNLKRRNSQHFEIENCYSEVENVDIVQGEPAENVSINSVVAEPPQKKRKRVVQINYSEFESLMSSNYGKTIKQFYNNNNGLVRRIRDRLSGYIIGSLITDLNCSLPGQNINDIAEFIVKMFPKESKESYYLVSKINNKKVYAGRLHSKYKNHRHFLSISSNGSNNNECNDEIPAEASNKAEDDRRLLWLRNNISPWTQVVDLWNKTFDARKLLNKTEKLSKLIYDYPALKLENGYSLVCQYRFNKIFIVLLQSFYFIIFLVKKMK